MKSVLELTITFDVVNLPKGAENDPAAIAKALDVSVCAVLDVTLFRGEKGFVAVVKSANRRINFANVFKELDCSWGAFPSKEELHKIGAKDHASPFALAGNPDVKIVVDAWVLMQQPKILVIPIGHDRAIRTCVTDLMVGTAATVLGGISIAT